MQTNQVIPRLIAGNLSSVPRPALIELTGARQTGKTTLARAAFPNLNYWTMDDPRQRAAVRELDAASWPTVVGEAILDEAHKEPSLFDTLKAAYDAGAIKFSVILGSAQIVMLRKVRESLAGRATLRELFPLMACELAADGVIRPPLVAKLFENDAKADDLLSTPATPLPRATEAVAHLLEWGGMPALLPLAANFRRQWLADYDTTYLERDLSDLGALSDLSPFRECQTLTMARSGQLLSYAELAREAKIGATTARRYVEYLQISYQAFLLPPYARNLTSQVVKSPKVYATDVGLLRQQTAQWGAANGAIFETFVVGEIYKWWRTAARPFGQMFFYRTRSGLEVDVLLSTDSGVWGIELKQSSRLGSKDWRGLHEIAAALKGEWRGGIVVYQGAERERLSEGIWAVPVGEFVA